MMSRRGLSTIRTLAVFLFCLVAAVYPGSAFACYQDPPPIDAFTRPSDLNTLLGVIDPELQKLLPQGIVNVIPQIPRVVEEQMEAMLDLERDPQGKLKLSASQQKARDYFITEFTKKISAGAESVPPPVTAGQPSSSLKPSKRLEPQDVNIRLYGMQEWDKIKNDSQLDTPAKKVEALNKRILEFAAQVCDFPNNSDPKQATNEEGDYLKEIGKQISEGQMTRPDRATQLGLSDSGLREIRDALIIKATTLAQTLDSTSTEFKDKLQQAGFEEFRKKANLGAAADLSDLQQRWIRSQVRQVISLLPLQPSDKLPVDVTNVPTDTRDKISTWLKYIVNTVFPLIPNLDSNGRKTNLIKFLKDNKDKLGIAESVAEALVEQFLKDNPSANQPTTPTTTTTTTTTNVTGTMMVQQPTIGGTPYILVPYGYGRHCLLRW